MAITAASIITLFNTFVGDDSTDRISAAERLQFISEATTWLYEELGNEHSVNTYNVNFLDGVFRYKVTSAIADLLTGADLRRDTEWHNESFTRKSPRELWEEIGQGVKDDPSWAIERYDGNAYLVINFQPRYSAIQIDDMDAVGDWVVDSTNSDATNLTLDSNEFKQGSGSLNFDADVSQSGNNRSTIYNPEMGGNDWSSVEDLGSFRFWAYIPSVTNFSSYTLIWGSDEDTTPAGKTNYWSVTATTDINGSAFANGWNEVKVDWANATATGTPDSEDINYMQIDANYTGSQTDDTDFRIDYITVAHPERLTFHYISDYVGASNSGTDLFAFTATTDIPFFSGQYDNYKYSVAHKAASIAFYGLLRLPTEAAIHDNEATKSLDRYRKNFESSKVREEKSFKIRGNNLRFRKTKRRR
jgi:hypothetical protein